MLAGAGAIDDVKPMDASNNTIYINLSEPLRDLVEIPKIKSLIDIKVEDLIEENVV